MSTTSTLTFAPGDASRQPLTHGRGLVDDGLTAAQVFAGEATRSAYTTDEAVEGRDAFLAEREPDRSPHPYHY